MFALTALHDRAAGLRKRIALPEGEDERTIRAAAWLADRDIVNVSDVMKQDLGFFRKFFWACLEKGIYLAPSPYETGFISLAHTEADLDDTLTVFSEVLAKI